MGRGRGTWRAIFAVVTWRCPWQFQSEGIFMKSMNHWLRFSPQFPPLALDTVKQQADPISYQPRSTNSLILSSMSQNHSNNIGGFQNSANSCYNPLRSGGDGDNSNSAQGLEMMRSDGSLCIMEALTRSHSAGKNVDFSDPSPQHHADSASPAECVYQNH